MIAMKTVVLGLQPGTVTAGVVQSEIRSNILIFMKRNMLCGALSVRQPGLA